ncbi:MAG: hypothetical protein HQL47_05400 [Gammaproteobacteria bacterium]|nr:hypothetical protein [Gammaproteobacteria bacterium]
MNLGIDPGLGGAAMLITSDGEEIIRCWDMPTTTSGKARTVNAALLADQIKEAIEVSNQHGERLQAILEAVHAMPGQGVTSMFNFGVSFGVVQGVLAALEVRTSLITPATWKKRAGLTGKPKDACRGLACSLWPEQAGLFARVKDQGRADAALIAFFGSRE